MNCLSHRGGITRIALAMSLLLMAPGGAIVHAQEEYLIPEGVAGIEGAPPIAYQGGGSFFSQELNTHLRVRYNTQSYGQDEGNLDLGTMRLFDLGDAAAFFDGQVTLNDAGGVGYNVGGGYRWLADQTLAFDPDPQRIMGVSLWADGTHTESKQFFPQIGVSLEALGEQWDFRANGYFPTERTKNGTFSTTGNVVFLGNGLAQETSAVRDTALTVGEFEIARRLANRDAWAFGGAYGLTGGEIDGTTGFRAGVRGYAFPDLLVQLAVTDDDQFNTNTVFSIVWFIGRTRSNYCATCSVADRLREPVLRNDYVATAQTRAFSGIPLTDAGDAPFSFVHVDSQASATGDGTFENPFNDISPVFLNSQEGDTIFLHGGSQFENTSIALRDNQMLLGEGDGRILTVATSELGMVNLPETAPGARDLAKPSISQTGGGTSVTLASNNTVDNILIDGGATAIDGTTLTENPTLLNLDILNTTGDGIMLQSFARDDTDDTDGDLATTEIDFNVNIDTVTFTNIGGDDISINADPGVDTSLPNTDLNEAIVITNITSTGGTGNGVNLVSTNTGGTASITASTFDGNASGLAITSARGVVNVANVAVANSSSDAVLVTNSTDVNLNTLDINDAGASGLNLVHTDAQRFDVSVTSSNINGAVSQGVLATASGTGVYDVQFISLTTAGTAGEGILAQTTAGAGEVDFELTGSSLTVADVSALRFVGNQSVVRDIDFLLSGNTFINTSNTQQTVDIDVNNSARLNATVINNPNLTNNGSASEFALDSNNAGSRVRLLLNNNTADAGAGDFDLTNNAGTYTVEDLFNVDANNTGDVNQTGVIGVDGGNIPRP